MDKREFAKLVNKYGAASIASVFGVPTPTVRRWKSEGLPKSREKDVRALETISRHEGFEEKSLREMMALAKESGKLPVIKNYSKRRDGEQTTGYEVSQKGSGMLNQASLLHIRSHLEKTKMAKGLPNWIASITVSAFVDEAEKSGSGDKRFQVGHESADNFVVESILSSGLQSSRKEAIDSLMSKLRQKMGESEARFYIHGTYFSTYQYKSKRESLDMQNKKRKARKT